MKRVVTLMTVAFVALFIMGGCAGPGIPEGSVLKAQYQGQFHSEYSSGIITVLVYDAPDGSRPVSGKLDPESGDAKGDFYGQMKGSRMEARMEAGLGELSGTVKGEMSADGQTMSGTISLDIKKGRPPATWDAKKK
jgi:hypothetical protein